MTFSETFKTTREKRGLTQEEAARELGVAVKTVSRWETGESQPQLDQYFKITDFFGQDFPGFPNLRKSQAS